MTTGEIYTFNIWSFHQLGYFLVVRRNREAQATLTTNNGLNFDLAHARRDTWKQVERLDVRAHFVPSLLVA